MFASHRLVRSSARSAVVVFLASVSCARGMENPGAIALADAAATAPSPGNDLEASAPSASGGPSTDDGAIATVAADDASDDGEFDAGVFEDGDAADDATGLAADDAGDEPPGVDPSIGTPAPGDLAITEIMLSPSGPEPQSEWFEIYNLASSARLLNGLTIEDGEGDTDVIASSAAIVVPAATYVLLVRDETAAQQAFVPTSSIVYAYGAGLASSDGIELDDGTDGDLSLWSGSALLADVPYGMWDASWVGQSIELATPQSDATDPHKWCVAQSPWASGSDDGTPGAASDCGP
jgi:hypothetical protein